MAWSFVELSVRKEQFDRSIIQALDRWHLFVEQEIASLLRTSGVVRRMPLTDDMAQMLDDLGIEPLYYDFPSISWSLPKFVPGFQSETDHGG